MKCAKVSIVVALIVMLLTACGASSSIEGRWEVPGRGDDATTTDLVKLEFFSDGTYTSNLSNYSGKYSIDDDRLKLGGVLVEPVTVTFKIEEETLIFYDDDGEILYEYQRIE